MKLNAGRGFRPDIPDPRCSHICLNFAAKGEWGMSRYASGQKFCTVCHVYMKVESSDCPCCNEKLRTKSPVSNKK